MRVRVLEEFSPQYVSKFAGLPRGFDPDKTYFVHKIESYSESGNGFVILVNDAQEIWWVDNRHVRCASEDTPVPTYPDLDRVPAFML